VCPDQSIRRRIEQASICCARFQKLASGFDARKSYDRNATAAGRSAKRISLGVQLEMQSMESGRIRGD